jgi:hypothetical protein
MKRRSDFDRHPGIGHGLSGARRTLGANPVPAPTNDTGEDRDSHSDGHKGIATHAMGVLRRASANGGIDGMSHAVTSQQAKNADNQ